MCWKREPVDTAGSYQLFLVITEKSNSCDHIKVCQHCIVLHLLPSVKKKDCGGRAKCGIVTKYKGSNCWRSLNFNIKCPLKQIPFSSCQMPWWQIIYALNTFL